MTDFSSPRSRPNRPPVYQGDEDPTSPQPARVAGRTVPASDHPDRAPASRDVDQRLGDFAPQAGQRASREVAGALAVAAVFVVASAVFYIGFADTAGSSGAGLGNLQVSNLVLGLTIGVALLLAGVGLVRWSRVLMTNNPIVEHTVAGGLPQNGFGEGPAGRKLRRRPLIRNAALGALALLPLPAVLALRGFDPDASRRRAQTAWAEGVRLLTDQSYRPIRASDLQVGEMVNVMPASFLDLPEQGPARMNERAKAPVVLVRMQPEEVTPAPGRENWHVDGIIAYSKICTHVGCPVSLYERTTHHLLCPCHQATFDLSDTGAVVFGPATRSLPQLPLAVDEDGFLVAQSDFTEAVGPGYWEREA